LALSYGYVSENLKYRKLQVTNTVAGFLMAPLFDEKVNPLEILWQVQDFSKAAMLKKKICKSFHQLQLDE
jgi:hypothetical protein